MTLMRVLGGSEVASRHIHKPLGLALAEFPCLRVALLTQRNLAKFARCYYPATKWLRAFLYLPFTIHHLPLFIVLDSDLTAISLYHIPFIYLRQVKQVPYFLIPFHWLEPFHTIPREEGKLAEVKVPLVLVKIHSHKGESLKEAPGAADHIVEERRLFHCITAGILPDERQLLEIHVKESNL